MTIEIKNVCAIESLTIPEPEDGGVVVFKGRNGSGKSTAIDCVASLYDSKTRRRLNVRDDHARGSITGKNVVVRLGKNNTLTGELECDSIEGNLDPSVFVDPGMIGRAHV